MVKTCSLKYLSTVSKQYMLEISFFKITDFWKYQTSVFFRETTCKTLNYLVNKASGKYSSSYETAEKEQSVNNLLISLTTGNYLPHSYMVIILKYIPNELALNDLCWE